ncbi:MAG: biotin/lipoyl-binding protein [Bacillota bacterium]|nr:biotin/lipoyl-binding protein [Bacillota bacterium]
MRITKKTAKIAAVSTAGVLLLGGGIWFAAGKLKKPEIKVYSMEELSQQMWGETNSLEGAVSSNVSQEVRLMDKQLVSQVHVQEGQEVKAGDPLLTYDMTLVNIDLEMEKLNKEQLKVKKKGLENELKNLKDEKKNVAAGNKSYKIEFLSNAEEIKPEEEKPEQQPEEKPEEPKPEEPETPQEQARPSGVYKRLYRDITIDKTEFPNDDAIIENAIPYSGKGTKDDPYVYVCQKGVLIQGEFLNQLAGFDASGNRVRDPYYCKLEVRSDNSFDGTLQAAMILDGSAIESVVEASAWFRTRLGKNEWEEMLPEENVPQGEVLPELPDGTGNEIPEEEIVGGYSKEELEKAIKEKEKEIKTTELDIKEADLKIKKVEQELQSETVTSTVDGVVKKVGDPAKGEIDGEPFIIVESSGGVYIKGVVSEALLEKVQPGQLVTGMAYESGTFFEAEVKEVSPYPASGYQSYDGRELTYYPFTAYIADSTGLKDNEMVSMDLPADEGGMSGMFIGKEYIRSKNGEDFVYKEGKNGKLEKQPIRTGQTFYGSIIEVKDGLTMEDHIAFPYGKKVKEGAKVKRASLAEENMF